MQDAGALARIHRYNLQPVLARVMTFYSEGSKVVPLVESLRSDLPPVYASFPGFRGLIVLEKPDMHNHVIAVTLWEDEESVLASEALADTVADRIAQATGTSASRKIYKVLGTIGVEERRPAAG